MSQSRWRLKTQGGVADRGMQTAKLVISLCARLAVFQVRFDLEASDEIQLAVEIRVNQPVRLLTDQFKLSLLMRLTNNSRSRLRPRARRDMTVPMGKSAMVEICL